MVIRFLYASDGWVLMLNETLFHKIYFEIAYMILSGREARFGRLLYRKVQRPMKWFCIE